jgi:phosphonate transport system permease protein
MRLALRKYQSTIWSVVALALVLWAVTGLNFRGFDWSRVLPNIGVVLGGLFLRTEWSYAPEAALKLLDTIMMAILGTLVASILAVPFGFLAAKNVSGWGARVGRFLLNLIRTFPEVVLAIVFIKGVGPGPLAGIMAMGIHSIGLLGKLYGDVVEAIDKGPIEAIQAAGGNRIQQIWYGVIPQVLPEFASYALYRFEINSRAAVVLGVVGAGGIGAPLIFAIQQVDWGRVGIILLEIVLVVSAIDLGSGRIRKKLV